MSPYSWSLNSKFFRWLSRHSRSSRSCSIGRALSSRSRETKHPASIAFAFHSDKPTISARASVYTQPRSKVRRTVVLSQPIVFSSKTTSPGASGSTGLCSSNFRYVPSIRDVVFLDIELTTSTQIKWGIQIGYCLIVGDLVSAYSFRRHTLDILLKSRHDGRKASLTDSNSFPPHFRGSS